MKQNKEVVLVLCAGHVTRDAEFELMDKYRMFEIATANVRYVNESDLNAVSAVVAPHCRGIANTLRGYHQYPLRGMAIPFEGVHHVFLGGIRGLE